MRDEQDLARLRARLAESVTGLGRDGVSCTLAERILTRALRSPLLLGRIVDEEVDAALAPARDEVRRTGDDLAEFDAEVEQYKQELIERGGLALRERVYRDALSEARDGIAKLAFRSPWRLKTPDGQAVLQRLVDRLRSICVPDDEIERLSLDLCAEAIRRHL